VADSRINFFYSNGRLYGALLRICGRMHVVGLSRRGIFWRFGREVFSPVPGYWESMFGLRYTISSRYYSDTGIKLFFTLGMKDEKIILRIRPRGIRGAISFSRAGSISIFLNKLDTEIFSPIAYRDYKGIASSESEANRVYESSEE
jgi:hypothetical protein